MAPLVGKVVRVIGTQRADLNGQEGRVESFNDATGRYEKANCIKVVTAPQATAVPLPAMWVTVSSGAMV